MRPTTDKDALVASQIAYMNIEEKDIRDAKKEYGSATLENIFKVSNDNIEKQYINRVYGNKDPKTTKLSEYEQMRFEEAKAFIEEIKNSEYAQWEIVEVKDDNANSGFYGCMIDCGDGQSIFGFRGSESDTTHQLRQDWINADIALFNNILTEQQKAAQNFVKDMNKKYGDNYTTFDFSGHSLGGNLSQHAGITVPANMQNKVGTIYNLDGPGYSDEYLLSHALEIDNMASHVKHYQWSFIGNLLNQMPDEMFQSIRTDDRVYEIYDLEKLTDGALFQKHDTGFVWRWMMEHDTEFFQNGKMDDFAKTVGVVIRKIENEAPGVVRNLAVDGIFLINLFLLAKESENTKEFGKKVCKYFIDTFQNGVHIGMEIWDSIERGISKWAAAGVDFIALFKNPYFRQVNDFKKKAGRITSTYGHLDMESKLISLNNMTETYQNLDHLMKMYKTFLIASADSYREAGKLMLLKEKDIL